MTKMTADIRLIKIDGEQPVEFAWLEAWRSHRPVTATPFSKPAIAACVALSHTLFSMPDVKARPDLVALAYWLRQAAIETMEQSFHAELPAKCKVVPRGVILHFPPTNVDTVLAYTWALTVLSGNRAAIRVSDRLGETGRQLVIQMLNVLAKSEESIARSTLFLHWDHDDRLTAAVSALADVRVVWGGDASVSKLRAVPATPRCRDVLFPDRRSMAALSLKAYLSLDSAGRDQLADAFFVDSLTFDQMACSSPRLLAWIGDSNVESTEDDFLARVAAAATRRRYDVPLGQQLAKQTLAAGALMDGLATQWKHVAPSVLALDWVDVAVEPADWVGGGLFLQVRLDCLAELASACGSRVQTLAVHGFTASEIEELIIAAGERSPDRIVPFGKALAFDRIWDGLNLLQEFTRLVHCP
ncbi:conserved hypothetical protein [Rhodospirillaceae bacterium LM-1]|nr:conserved hypothetical protein [Rhodospirillaceae bacterium LM-1]